MFDRISNRISDASVTRAMKKYRTCPATRTAIIFVNVQQALMANQPSLMANLERLQTLAREKAFRIVHAPYDVSSQ